jgi:GNAT superfamily N-acetyltransferase
MTHDPSTDRLVDLPAATPAGLEQARAIYEAGFPAAVRAPFSDLLGAHPAERTQLLLDGTGEVIGLTLVRDLGDTRWTFLRYFVVTAERRGSGIGGRLWAALCRDLADRSQELLLFDVEDPADPAATAHETVERHRRVTFYRRLGAELVDFAAYEPPHHGEPGSQALPLRLMAARLDVNGGSSPPRLLGAEAERAVESVLRHRYGVD